MSGICIFLCYMFAFDVNSSHFPLMKAGVLAETFYFLSCIHLVTNPFLKSDIIDACFYFKILELSAENNNCFFFRLLFMRQAILQVILIITTGCVLVHGLLRIFYGYVNGIRIKEDYLPPPIIQLPFPIS